MKQKAPLKRLMMPVIILLSLWLCTTALTQEPETETTSEVDRTEIPDDLVLPVPKILEQPDVTLLAFTKEGYSTILKMYTAYQLYLDLEIDYHEIQYHYDNELRFCGKQLELSDETLRLSEIDREFAYKTTKSAMENLEKEQKRNKIRTIFLTSGATLAGVGIGILVGFLVSSAN